jgi:uncharacterized protein YgbK (DUF1537 family)
VAGLPSPRRVPVDQLMAAVKASGRWLAVLDDDPTGTQSISGLPVLTSWSGDDMRWALGQAPGAFFVLTNSRSLSPADMRARNQEVVASLTAAARAENTAFVVASRSDSTLRGHYPEEVDAISAALAAEGGRPVDGVVLAPAYVDAGRMTVRSVHWVRSQDVLVPAALSEFAADATFGYRSSHLADYVEEKTSGRWRASEVARITLEDIRTGGPEAVAATLAELKDGRPAVVDAVCDDDLRVVALGALAAEAGGAHLLYRVGPSFVRARSGQAGRPPLTADELASILPGRSGARHGLVVVGSHVPRTSRQLQALHGAGGLGRVELDVRRALVPEHREAELARAAGEAVGALGHGHVVLATTRDLVTGAGPDESLAIARAVSASLASVVRAILARTELAWLVAKGGITSSDLVTGALGAGRAWARGTLLPGMVSLWELGNGPFSGLPYVVFAGNVGDDEALATVVAKLGQSR